MPYGLPKFDSHVYKLRRGECICFYFAIGVQRVASIEKHPIYSKQIGDGPILHTKEKQSVSDP